MTDHSEEPRTEAGRAMLFDFEWPTRDDKKAAREAIRRIEREARYDIDVLRQEFDDLEAEIETEDVPLSDSEVETIYAAYALVLGLEARSIQGRRDIVEPLYRAVIQARINTARTIAASPMRLRASDTSKEPTDG